MDVSFMWVLIVLIVTAGIVLVAMFTSAARSDRKKQLTPDQALKLRYAKGEITEADFLRSMAILEHDRLLELGD